MSTLIITVTKDNSIFDVGNESRVFLFDNVHEYHDEICDIIEENKLPYEELKILVESWGGNIDLVSLNELIKFYKKNKDQGLHF